MIKKELKRIEILDKSMIGKNSTSCSKVKNLQAQKLRNRSSSMASSTKVRPKYRWGPPLVSHGARKVLAYAFEVRTEPRERVTQLSKDEGDPDGPTRDGTLLPAIETSRNRSCVIHP